MLPFMPTQGAECPLEEVSRWLKGLRRAILQAAKAKGVHTAVETAGHVPRKALKVLPYTDLFLYDLKHMDPEVHRQWIGQDNRLILSTWRS